MKDFIDRAIQSFKKRRTRKRLKKKFGQSWNQPDTNLAFLQRSYSSYEDYLEHQKSKLAVHDLTEYDVRYREVLRERLRKIELDWPGRTVLCLAARIGTEVKAFLDLGCFAVGIDLNPGQQNRYVVTGDFHDLQFASGSVDVVFTNSLDHAFEIERIAREIRRVLKPGGVFIAEAVAGKQEGKDPGFFESFYWGKIDDLAALFEQHGFKLRSREPFDYPWPGAQLLLENPLRPEMQR